MACFEKRAGEVQGGSPWPCTPRWRSLALWAQGALAGAALSLLSALPAQVSSPAHRTSGALPHPTASPEAQRGRKGLGHLGDVRRSSGLRTDTAHGQKQPVRVTSHAELAVTQRRAGGALAATLEACTRVDVLLSAGFLRFSAEDRAVSGDKRSRSLCPISAGPTAPEASRVQFTSVREKAPHAPCLAEAYKLELYNLV
nr:uncharacterized protein LOC123287054 isoform X2 [Equus asinus]XP_044629365.1 uncharacterized protein LOC123287054 isoform X2 [Equus asinus]